MPTVNIPKTISIQTTIKKNYNIKITPVKQYNSTYSGPVEWIPYWFYTQYDTESDNVTFEILGDFHETFPNPPHLSIKAIYENGNILPIIHLSYDSYTKQGYIQPVNAYGRKKKKLSKKKLSKKKLSKKKLSKKKLSKKKL
jgi:hypothetical protein